MFLRAIAIGYFKKGRIVYYTCKWWQASSQTLKPGDKLTCYQLISAEISMILSPSFL